MKWYPISEGELGLLSIADTASTVAFSFASAAAVFALDLTKDFAITAGVPPEAAALWGGFQTAAWIISGVAAIIGSILLWWRNSTVKQIKQSTDFS